jgi:hypothetical protein
MKYTYKKVIQQHFGNGWEDVSEYHANSTGQATEKNDDKDPNSKPGSLLLHDLTEYKRIGCPTRVIFRREKNDK